MPHWRTVWRASQDLLGPRVGHGRSLARQLLLWLLLPQVVLWMAGGVAAYRLASGYVNEAIDASLLQASRALARQLKPIGNGLMVDFPKAAQDVLEADPEDRLMYKVSSPPGNFILGLNAVPQVPNHSQAARDGSPLFYDGQMTVPGKGEQAVRVAALWLRLGESAGGEGQTLLVQVARSSASREGLARRILVDMLLPLSSLMLLMTLIIGWGVRAGLAPLHRLRLQVEGRAPTDLAPLQLDSAPREVLSLASAINTLLSEVRHNVEVQKRFIGDAAHQLRTPLAGLKSQTELALGLTEQPELRKRLHFVHDSAVRSAHLVAQLLALARAEPESLGPHSRQAVDLGQLAQQVAAALVPRALKAGVDLGLEDVVPDGAERAIRVHGNALLLREAVVNVVENAIEYAGDGATVTISVRSEGAQALLSVEDNGPGIPPADRDRVLERFVRATDRGNGCGLGLAIVKEVVERHAGQVRLLAVEPHGLRVELVLPMWAEGGGY